MLKYSLLSEALFSVTTPAGVVTSFSLPQVLSSLSQGDALEFNRLRPHQSAPWHAFLVQLAYLALSDGDEPAISGTADEWTLRLRSLTLDFPDDAPWFLLNTDWQKPAFLQSPCSPGRESEFAHPVRAAQDLDILVTSRHHDEKAGKVAIDLATLDTLLFALVSLQGWTPFLGPGNYNSMRMNGGFGSRAHFRLAFARGAGQEFLRDIKALIATEETLVESANGLGIGTGTMTPHKLLWLPVWDDGSLSVSVVHPLCLEVCRRIRVTEADSELAVKHASSKGMRVAADELCGVVADPWSPVDIVGSPKALTANPNSLGYRSLQGILFEPSKYQLPILAKATTSERAASLPATLIAQVLVGGKGKTNGLLKRELQVPIKTIVCLANTHAVLTERSRQFVNLASVAAGKVYRSALLQFLDGSDAVDKSWKNRDFSKAVEPWVDRFEQAVDEAFFATLFDTIEHELAEPAAQSTWVRWLADTASAHLQQAVMALPTREPSRLFATARAERFLRFSLRKQFGALLQPPRVAEPTAPEEAAHG